MKFSNAAVAAAVCSGVIAAPLAKKSTAINDAQILNYALTLEHLEDTFYRQGLANYSQSDFAAAGFGTPFYTQLQEISRDETTHVAFLTGALKAAGYPAVAACNYSFGTTKPADFIALASILEGVGVSAYLGAAASIANKAYLTAAGSILTVEARHNAFIRNREGEAPFAYPFDTPLDFDEVYTLASSFITGCPASNPTLPVKEFPKLIVSDYPSPTVTGSQVWVKTTGYTLTKPTYYVAFASVTGPIFVPAKISSDQQTATFNVPAGVAGQTYLVLTTQNSTVTDANIAAGPAILEVTPAFET